jgi:lipopolysaccharide export system protein LptA
MQRHMKYIVGIVGAALFLIMPANAAAPALAKDKPIEISADSLDVRQEEHKAIFTGNVIATQGSTNLRATTMTVYYRQGETKQVTAPSASAQGISKIEAQGSVVFATPTETAQGDFAIYNADTDTIDLTGASVTLTREQNVLKGQKLNYNLATGRSVLTAGGAAVTGGAKPARVHGLFVPKSDKK